MSAAELDRRWWNVFGSTDLADIQIADTDYLRVRPRVGIEVIFPFEMSLGNEVAWYKHPYGPGSVERTEVGFRLGWSFFDRRLQLVGRLNSVNTSYTGFDSGSHTGAGLEVVYKIPLSKRFALQIGAGWTYSSQVTLSSDTGVPAAGSFGNALCTIFTLGLANGCGNIITHVTIPRSTYYHLGVGVGWVF